MTLNKVYLKIILPKTVGFKIRPTEETLEYLEFRALLGALIYFVTMPSAKNISELNKLKEKFEQAKTVVLSDYRGLKVNQIAALRQKVKDVGGEIKVAKNTLIKLTLKNLKYEVPDEQLKGPTAVLFSFQDEVAPLKILYDFFKENDLPKIKAGFLEQKLITEDKVIDLAKIPNRQTLYGEVTGALRSPTFGLVYVLKANMSNLINVLKAVKQSKE